MTADDRLREALRHHGDRVEPSEHEWGHIENRRMAVERARRISLGLVSLLAVVAVAGVLLVRTPEPKDHRVVATPSPAEPTTTAPTPATVGPPGPPDQGPPSVGGAPPPPELVAITAGGRLVVIRTADGQILRTLVDGDGFSQLALSADRETVYVARVDEEGADPERCDRGMIHAASVAQRGPLRRVAPGSHPAINPDGLRLAYLAPAQGGCDQSPLVVRELATGKERRFPPPAEGGFCCWLAWSDDGESIAYARAVGDAYETWLLDTRTGGARPVGGGGGQSWEHPVFLAARNTMVVAAHDPANRPSGGGPGSQLLEVPPRGRATPELATVPGHLVIDLDADVRGEHLLVVTDDFVASRLDDEGNLFPILEGVSAADW